MFRYRLGAYLDAKPRSWHLAKLLEYWQFFQTSLLMISDRMRWIASSLKRWNGSDAAHGETPVPSGKFRSAMVCTFEGGLNSMCFAGSKSPVAMICTNLSSMSGSELGSAVTTPLGSPRDVMVAQQKGMVVVMVGRGAREASAFTG